MRNPLDIKWIIKDLAALHEMLGKNCAVHPQGARRCKDCRKNRYWRVSLGEAMRTVKKHYGTNP